MTTGISRAAAWVAWAGLVAGTASLAAAQPAASAWPLFHNDAQRTGRTTIVGPASPGKARIAFRGFGTLRSAPAIGPDGTVYLGTNSHLCAIDPALNRAKWCNDLTGTVTFSSPAVGVDPLNPSRVLIYIGARDNRLHAIDQDGRQRWEYAVGTDGDVATSPTIAANGTLFFGGVKRLHGMSPTGTLLWMRPLDSYIFTASPAIAPGPGGTVYAATIRGWLYAVNPDTGTVRWSLKAGRNVKFSAPVVGPDGTIYIGTRSGLTAVRDQGGSGVVKWTFPVPGRGVVSTPAIGADGTLYFGSQGGPVSGGTFWAVDANGQAKWAYPTPSFCRGAPILDGAGRVYLTSGRTVIALDAATGAKVWTFTTGRNVYAAPALDADGTLWVASGDRNLYAISAD